jgi:A/G-specific adenine glycosylase
VTHERIADQVEPYLTAGRVDELIDWFERHARELPWRHDRTPYRIWVAEVMLQQTRVESASPYYRRFLERFPTLESLAAASMEEVLKVWEGLGYYARARHLHAAARQVIDQHEGRLPDTFDALQALPGIGPYTAGAIASLAFERPVVALDGNARRVLARLFAVEGNPRRSSTQRRLKELAQALLPPDRPGPFNEALVELGATVCRPRSPRCSQCPLAANCRAHHEGREEDFPERAPSRAIPHYDVSAAAVFRDDEVLIAQRHPESFLGGLWEFPGGKREADESLEECLVREMKEELDVDVEVGEQFLSLQHVYSHFRITLYAFRCRLKDGTPRCLECADFRWVKPQELDDLPMAVTDRQIADAVQEWMGGTQEHA